jgi:hypothetical protein
MLESIGSHIKVRGPRSCYGVRAERTRAGNQVSPAHPVWVASYCSCHASEDPVLQPWRSPAWQGYLRAAPSYPEWSFSELKRKCSGPTEFAETVRTGRRRWFGTQVALAEQPSQACVKFGCFTSVD